jgi:glycine cleavage system aminomethyltransferase T
MYPTWVKFGKCALIGLVTIYLQYPSIYGRHRASFLEHLVVADITSLAPYHAVLSLLTNEQGGIMDDTIITNMGDHL